MGAPDMIVNGTAAGGPPIGGTGTTNTIPRWTGASTLGDSVISQDNGTNRLLIAGGTAAAAANGTNITIQAQTGGTGNTNGGDIILLGGTRSGSGTFGRVAVGTSKPVARVTIGSEGLNVNNPTLGNAVGVPLLISSADPTIFGLVMGCNAGDGRSWIQAMRTDASPTAYNITLNELGGNVGIGTANPTAKLHVTQGSSPNFANLLIGSAGTSTNFYDANEHYFRNGSLATGMYMSSLGNVGIGTASPSARLHSVAADGTYQFAVSGTTRAVRFLMNATSANIEGVDPTLSASYQPLTIGGSTVTLANSGSPALTVNTSGNVGIGTASPGASLHVLSTGANPFILASTQTTTYLDIRTSTSTSVGYVGTGGMVVGGAASDLALRAVPAGANVIIAGPGGALRGTFGSTALDVSHVSGYGLKLQGTAGTNNTDPNVLDFYADGGTPNSGGVTWTPTLNFGGATTGITYAANGQVGRYTRVGNMVYLTMYIKLSSKGSATGNATITGLPTSANVPGLHASGAVGIIANITFANQMTAALLANSAELRLYETTNAGLVTTITDADFAANSELAISIAYPVN